MCSSSVQDHPKLGTGYCSQNEKKLHLGLSTNPNAKRWDHVGMNRFLCASQLALTCRHVNDQNRIRVTVKHQMKHKEYFDVALPEEAKSIIRELENARPNDLVNEIQLSHPPNLEYL